MPKEITPAGLPNEEDTAKGVAVAVPSKVQSTGHNLGKTDDQKHTSHQRRVKGIGSQTSEDLFTQSNGNEASQ